MHNIIIVIILNDFVLLNIIDGRFIILIEELTAFLFSLKTRINQTKPILIKLLVTSKIALCFSVPKKKNSKEFITIILKKNNPINLFFFIFNFFNWGDIKLPPQNIIQFAN